MLTGDATAAGVSLRYPGGALTLPAMHFVAEGPQPEPRGKPALHASPHAGRKPQVATEPTQRALVLEAMPIAMGLPEPLVADARFTRAGFELNLAGQATLAKLLPAAANFGLLENASTLVAPKGRATLKTTTAGNWMRPLAESGSGIGTNGTLKIEGAELRPAFLPAPVAVESAEITLTPEEISWQNVTLVYKAMPLRGSIQFPAMCNQGVACPASFTLAADALDAATVEVALGGKSSGFLGQFFTNALGGGNGAKWPMLRGELQCATLRLGKLPLRGVTAALSVEGNKLTLSSVDATALGGPVRASREMAIEDGAPHWTLSTRLQGPTPRTWAGFWRTMGLRHTERRDAPDPERLSRAGSGVVGEGGFLVHVAEWLAARSGAGGRFSAGAFRALDGQRHYRQWRAGADWRRDCERGENERGAREHRV